MGKAASKVTRALGFGVKPDENNLQLNNQEEGKKTNQWDTTIDQLFGDAPLNEGPDEPTPSISESIKSKPKTKRRAPPAPPSILDIPYERPRRRRLPSSPNSARRRNRQRNVRPMRTPIISDHPRRTARSNLVAVNSVNSLERRSSTRRSTKGSRPRVILQETCSRSSSIRRRRRPSSCHRNLRLQELLQCPVCLNPYSEPRLLPCGHTFCDECLNRLISNEQDVVTCPVCRKEHLVPDDGIFTPNFIVRNLLEQGPIDFDRLSKSSKFSSVKMIRFFVAVRKITRSHSQVKRLTIEMSMVNFVRDSCEELIKRISKRERFDTPHSQFVLEFGEKRLRPQRTLNSYGVQNGDLLFLFNPSQRLNFLDFQDDRSSEGEDDELRSQRSTSSGSTNSNSIRPFNSNGNNYNRIDRTLNSIEDQNQNAESTFYNEI